MFFVFTSLSRYKLKFSPDKVDTMIVQAICKSFSSCLHPFIMLGLTLAEIKLSLWNKYFKLFNRESKIYIFKSVILWKSWRFVNSDFSYYLLIKSEIFVWLSLFSQPFWMTWIRNLTITLCAAESGMVGIFLSWGKSSRTTWLTANLSVMSVKTCFTIVVIWLTHYHIMDKLWTTVCLLRRKLNI